MTEADRPPDDVSDDAPTAMNGDEQAPKPGPENGADEERAELPVPTPLEAAQSRVAELEDKLLRVEAEFLNETKRIRKNADNQGRFAIERVVFDLLPVIDALHSARDNLKDDDTAHREGLELIERVFMDALGSHGIERVEAVGQPFDPGFHEAMLVVDDDTQPAQTVTQEMRAGYLLHGRVVRPSQVMVTRRTAAAAQADAAADEPDEPRGDA